jgi:hypothetical protein
VASISEVNYSGNSQINGITYTGTTLPVNASSIASGNTTQYTYTFKRQCTLKTSTSGSLSLDTALNASGGSAIALAGSYIRAKKLL